MLVALIHLPAPFLSDQKTLMPLGLLYVAASLEHHGHKAVIIDLAARTHYLEFALSELRKLDAELSIIGIGITSSQARIAGDLAREIRNAFPSKRLVAGGPHVTHVVQASCRQPQRTKPLLDHLRTHFDVLIAGDAELAILVAGDPACPKLLDAADPKSLFFVDQRILNELPYPARHLIDVQGYHYNLGHSKIEESNAVSIISQRGCPYACRFCAGRTDPVARTLRTMSVDKTIGEIEQLFYTYGYTDFTFYDDELNAGRQLDPLLTQLKDLQMHLGGCLRFRAFLRSNLATSTQIRELAAAGFKVIAIGAESGSPRILSNMMKNASTDQNARVLGWAKDHGLLTKSIMSLGHPGESVETLRQTESWLDSVKPDDLNFTIVSPLPSSAYYDQAVLRNGSWIYTAPESGDRLYDIGVDWSQEVHFFHGDPSTRYVSTVYTDYLSREEVIQWHTYFERKYRGSDELDGITNRAPQGDSGHIRN